MPLLASLPGPVFERLMERSRPRRLDAGEWCVRAGDAPDGVYVVVHGRLATIVSGELRDELGRGEVFGEIALLTGEPTTADVRALRDSEVLFVPREDFQATVEEDPFAMRQLAPAAVVKPADAPEATLRAGRARALGATYRYVLNLAPLADDPWSCWCMRQSDQIVVAESRVV